MHFPLDLDANNTGPRHMLYRYPNHVRDGNSRHHKRSHLSSSHLCLSKSGTRSGHRPALLHLSNCYALPSHRPLPQRGAVRPGRPPGLGRRSSEWPAYFARLPGSPQTKGSFLSDQGADDHVQRSVFSYNELL